MKIKSTVKQTNPLSENFLLQEKLDQKQIEAAVKLVASLEKVIGPVSGKLPKTNRAIAHAKSIIREETVGGVFSKIKSAITPDMLKPVTKFAEAVGFISALAQGLVQASQLFTTLSDIKKEDMDKPMSKIKSIDRNAALRQLTAAITPDGMLGFLRGMPLADEKTIARELMELSGNDFQMISDSVKHLKNNQKAAQETAEVAKEADKVVKQAKAPQKTEKIEIPKGDNATQAPKTQDKKEEKPANDEKVSTEKNTVEKQVKTAPLKPMSKKRYADGLYAAVKKSIKISPQEIKNFIDNIAGEIEKQGIQIEESKTLFGKFNKHVIKESLEFDVIRAAAEKAGITDEDQQIVIGYRLAKMIASDRATDNSGMIPKVFPKDFKILKVPIARATQLIGDSMSDTNKKYWDRQDTERNDALQRMQNPKMQTLKVPVVENPWGAKGNYIPLMMDSPGNIIIQGRDIAQETQDNNDYEYSLPSSLWLLDIDKLKEVISKFEDQRAGTSDVQQDDIQTQHQNRK